MACYASILALDRHRRQRLLALCLGLCAALTAIPLPAQAASEQHNCTFDSSRILAVWPGRVRSPVVPIFPAFYTATVHADNIAVFPPIPGGRMSRIRSTRGTIAFDYTRVVGGRIVPSFVRYGSAWAIPFDGSPPTFLENMIYLRRGTEAIISTNRTFCSVVDVGVGPVRRDAMADGTFCGRYLFDVEGPGPHWVDQWAKDDHEAWVDIESGDILRLTAAQGALTYYDYDKSRPPEYDFTPPPQCNVHNTGAAVGPPKVKLMSEMM